jgi:hypothetical protein
MTDSLTVALTEDDVTKAVQTTAVFYDALTQRGLKPHTFSPFFFALLRTVEGFPYCGDIETTAITTSPNAIHLRQVFDNSYKDFSIKAITTKQFVNTVMPLFDKVRGELAVERAEGQEIGQA